MLYVSASDYGLLVIYRQVRSVGQYGDIPQTHITDVDIARQLLRQAVSVGRMCTNRRKKGLDHHIH